MSHSHSHPKPDPLRPPHAVAPLLKQKSWSPDSYREEAWLRRKELCTRRTKSLADEDLDELKACIELGFRFDSPDLESDQRLWNTLPALGFYYAVNKSYNDTVSRSKSSSCLGTSSSSSESELSLSSPVGSPITMFTPGDDPKTIKTRLRQWAQVVACSVRQSG